MRIQRIEEAHIKKCSIMYIETFNSEPWNDKWDEDTSYIRLKDIFNTPGFFGLVAIEGAELKGAVFGNIEQWYDGYMYNLKEMFVKKDDKRSGIGTRLISELERSLKEEGINSINLFTSKGDLTEKFYEKNGFSSDEEMIMMDKGI